LIYVKRPTRIIAIALNMTLCALVYKLAEVRMRQWLAATGQTVLDLSLLTACAADAALALPVVRTH
jgi:hypothetical protein